MSFPCAHTFVTLTSLFVIKSQYTSSPLQAMSSFSQALSTGQLGPVISQFNLGAAVTEAAIGGDVEAFVSAMQATENAKKSQEVKKEDKVEVKKEEVKKEVKNEDEMNKEKSKKPEDMEID